MAFTAYNPPRGYPGWAGRIEGIKALLDASPDRDLTSEEVAAIGPQVADILESSKPPMDAIVRRAYIGLIDDFRIVDDQEEFNGLLDELYDFGDQQRVIIG